MLCGFWGLGLLGCLGYYVVVDASLQVFAGIVEALVRFLFMALHVKVAGFESGLPFKGCLFKGSVKLYYSRGLNALGVRFWLSVLLL